MLLACRDCDLVLIYGVMCMNTHVEMHIVHLVSVSLSLSLLIHFRQEVDIYVHLRLCIME